MTHRRRKVEEIANAIRREAASRDDVAALVDHAMQWQALVCSITFIKSPACDVQRLSEIIVNAGTEEISS